MKKNRPASPRNVPKQDFQQVLWIALGLFFVVLATFWACSNNGFINYDDPDYVTGNAQVQQGLTWAGVKWAFSSTRTTANWHPITWISHLLDYDLYGTS